VFINSFSEIYPWVMDMADRLRSPILTILGHVDHGKTTLLDKIRGTAIAKTEAGQITQAIGATNIMIDTIKDVCGPLFDQLKINVTIPGLLIIDTPGHEAFTTLRKRGGSIADLAILVIDINEGFKPQTEESLNFLKQFKTPFVVALTKVDRLLGWAQSPGSPFITTFNNQNNRVQDEFEEKLYKVIGELKSRGFEAERYDRVSDYAKQIALVPVSGITGEGIPDLLMVITGIAQRFMEEGLKVCVGTGKGTVLEVKDFKGLGTTIDAIVYDGEVRKGDHLVIGDPSSEKGFITTKIKALLEPEPLKELRVEKEFRQVDGVCAAAGVKIAAPGLENVMSGSPLRAVRTESELKAISSDVKAEIEDVEIETDNNGVLIKADTLGGLEALIKTLKDYGIPIRKALVGDLTKSEILEIRAMEDPMIFAFGVKIPEEVDKLAKDNRVRIFHSDIIYHLLEEYNSWMKDKKKREEDALLDSVTKPCRLRVLPGYVFRQSKPAVFGVEIMSGSIKPGNRLERNSKSVGEVKEVQLRGDNITEAKSGDKVALSMPDVTIGKEIKEGDILETHISEKNLETLEKVKTKLRDDERELLEEIKAKE
jgi:translation initiation factor 5B